MWYVSDNNQHYRNEENEKETSTRKETVETSSPLDAPCSSVDNSSKKNKPRDPWSSEATTLLVNFVEGKLRKARNR